MLGSERSSAIGRSLRVARWALLLALGALTSLVSPWGCGLSTEGIAGSNPCADDAECADDSDCTKDACSEGQCTHAELDDPGPFAQTPGDCKQVTCEGGAEKPVDDPTDSDDGNPCTVDSCSDDGVPEHDGGPLEGTSCQIGAATGSCINKVCTVACGANGSCDDSNPCTEDACNQTDNTCVFDPLHGVAVPGAALVPTDCRRDVCVSGKAENIAEDTEIPDDAKECTADVCVGGAPQNTPVAEGEPCGANSFCNDNGHCGCEVPNDCGALPTCVMSFVCDMAECTPIYAPNLTPVSDAACSYVVCDGAGGQVTNSKPAATPCPSGVCTGDGTSCVECVTDAQCMAPETCGGGEVANTCGCKPQPNSITCAGIVCATQKPNNCGMPVNCLSTCPVSGDSCANNICGCSNGQKGGTETDIDCGGICAANCPIGQGCSVDADCQSDGCTGGGTCAAVVTCGATPTVTCPAGQVCCFDGDFDAGCKNPGPCGSGDVELKCDGPSDCPAGQVCCGHHTSNWNGMSCKSTCTEMDEFVMCTGNAPCPPSKTCTDSSDAPGYQYCQ